MDSAQRDLLPPLLSLPLTTATEATGKARKPRDKSNRVNELGNSPRQERLAAVQKAAERAAAEAAERAAAEAAAPDDYVSSVVANMWNYRKWEAEAKWISNENKPADEGRWTRCNKDLIWESSTFFQICDAVCTECKYPDIYWVREMNPKGLTKVGYTGLCNLLDDPTGPPDKHQPYKHPLGQNENMKSNRSFMRKIQNLVTLDAVAQLATDVFAASFADPTLAGFMERAQGDRAGYYELVDWQTKEGDVEPIQVHAFGDYHGSLHSFAKQHSCAENRKAWYDGDKLKPHIRFVFLGDYIDRSFYSLEVLYLVLRLKDAFPNQVRMLAGNHESPYAGAWAGNQPPEYLSERMFWCGYGLQWEAAFSRDPKQVSIPTDDQIGKIIQLFHRLPKAIMARTDLGLIQFSHGVAEMSLFPICQQGQEPHYPNPAVPPEKTNAARLARRAVDFYNFLHPPAGPSTTLERFQVVDKDIVWSDVEEFIPDASGGVRQDEVSQRWALSAKAVQAYLERFHIETIVRGHQHNQSLSLTTGFDPINGDARHPPPWFLNSNLEAQGQFITGRDARSIQPYGEHHYDMSTWLPAELPWNWNSFASFFYGKAGNIQPGTRPIPLDKDHESLNHFKVELYGEYKGRRMPLVITTASSGWSCTPKSNLNAFSPVITFTKKLRPGAAAAAAAAAAGPSSPTGPDVDMAEAPVYQEVLGPDGVWRSVQS